MFLALALNFIIADMTDELLENFELSATTVVPRNFTFTLEDLKVIVPAAILSISVYSVLLFFGLIGNLVVFSTLLKSRYRKSSRVNKLILHLAIAGNFGSRHS